MAGERVLLIDSSAAVQEVGKVALEEAGFRVSTGSNGVAALTVPEIEKFDVMVVDVNANGLDGFLVTRELRTNASTHSIPVLLLVPEEEAEQRASQPLRGASGYLLKPFKPATLVSRVSALAEERSVKEQSEKLLREAADTFMNKLAEQHIREAAEKRTQIIVERSIQTIVTQLDQRIGHEVNQRMTALTAEREEQLVRATVHEVAQSMVEKLAERKVGEAIQSVLNEVTEKTVKKSADTHIPALARRLLKESLDLMLPREVGNQVEKSIASFLPEFSNKMVETVEEVGQKVIPKVARDKLPELTERHLRAAAEKGLPEVVHNLVARELSQQIDQYLELSVRDVATRLNRKVIAIMILAIVVIVLCAAGIFGWLYLTIWR